MAGSRRHGSAGTVIKEQLVIKMPSLRTYRQEIPSADEAEGQRQRGYERKRAQEGLGKAYDKAYASPRRVVEHETLTKLRAAEERGLAKAQKYVSRFAKALGSGYCTHVCARIEEAPMSKEVASWGADNPSMGGFTKEKSAWGKVGVAVASLGLGTAGLQLLASKVLPARKALKDIAKTADSPQKRRAAAKLGEVLVRSGVGALLVMLAMYATCRACSRSQIRELEASSKRLARGHGVLYKDKEGTRRMGPPPPDFRSAFGSKREEEPFYV